MRNPNPFTERQLHLLEAIQKKIQQINDPDPEIITHESYEWSSEQTKQFGKIPKIKFQPCCSQIKAEIIREAKLEDEAKEKELRLIREKYGIRAARHKEARLFESEWNNIMLKAKKATFTIALINQLFSDQNQTVSDPIKLIQQIVMDEYTTQIKTKKSPIRPSRPGKTAETQENRGITPYDKELTELK